jgi:hypothetical protein
MMRREDRGERWGRVVRRLGRRSNMGEKGMGKRGASSRGTGGLEILPCGGNKGGKTHKHSRARREDREEPSMVASMQVGLLDQTT